MKYIFIIPVLEFSCFEISSLNLRFHVSAVEWNETAYNKLPIYSKWHLLFLMIYSCPSCGIIFVTRKQEQQLQPWKYVGPLVGMHGYGKRLGIVSPLTLSLILRQKISLLTADSLPAPNSAPFLPANQGLLRLVHFVIKLWFYSLVEWY